MKYTLDKSSRKFTCPSCNKKRFVRFIEIETNQYLHETLGRCDRETSCGYFKKPDTDKSIYIYTPIPNNTNSKISYHDPEILHKSLRQYHNNNFYRYLTSLFPEEKVKEVFNSYRIGTSKNWKGGTVFWLIDNENKIRAGKILLLDRITCKRIKEPFPHISWVHKKLKLETFNLSQCIFGLHLIHLKKKVAIVESEKTAIIMSLFLPEFTWMSTGSKQNFKSNLLAPLKNKEVIAFPDKGEFNDWRRKVDELNKLGFKIKVSDYIEKLDFDSGTDLADIYIDINHRNPTFEELTKDEKEVLILSKANPNLLLLIETFDLLDGSDNPFDLKKLNYFL